MFKKATPEQEDKVKVFLNKALSEKKTTQIVASFSSIEELQDFHIQHFREAEYIWKSMNGSIFGGTWMNDNINYIHNVLVTQNVLDYLLALNRNVNATN
jgi:hypothetical protein